MNTRDQMRRAKRLIQEKRYDEARKLLVTIHHPQAAVWLAKINARSPLPRRRRWPYTVVVVIVVLALVLGAWTLWQAAEGGARGSARGALFTQCLQILPASEDRQQRCSAWASAHADSVEARQCLQHVSPPLCLTPLPPAP